MSDFWSGGDDDDAPPEGEKADESAAQGEAPGEAPAEGGEAPAEGEQPAEEPVPEADEEYLDPDKLILFKHWKRPKFLPYKYLYLYRRNYYDDVMDYLDKRARGISREIPRAQTWAERVLRSFSTRFTEYSIICTKKAQNDFEMIEKTSMSGKFYYYHTKNFFNRPKFLPYKCITDYRLNYYDDIMEVLESRRRGVKRNIPPAQTWAERICRQRSHPLWKLQRFDKHLDDIRFVTKTEISGSFYSYYTKETFNKRYSKLLY